MGYFIKTVWISMIYSSINTTLIPSVIPYITVEYEILLDPPETGRIDSPLALCVNNSPPLHLTTTTPPDWTQSITNCETVTTSTIKPSTPPDQTNSITTPPESKGIGVPIVIAVIVVLVILLTGLISASGVLVLLMVYRRSRNSTTQNTSTIMAHNDRTGPLSGRQQNPYEFS